MGGQARKLVLAVKTWGSEESVHAWKYLKSHVLVGKDGRWSDELVVVHVAKSKEREKERWDQGGAVIAGMRTALQPYKHDVFDLEGDAQHLLVDVANKEQADILVLATRGRNAVKKAMMGGSTTDFVMQRVSCACLIVKPQVGAGDSYRIKSAVQPQAPGAVLHSVSSLQAPRVHSPASSPLFRLGSLPGTTPFNRRVAIAYDTTASGRFLLHWAAENILEPADNVFVLRAVPKMRKPGVSFADKNSVQRLAGDALQGQAHLTTFNLQQGNARKSVLGFAAKESVDLLIIGMYKPGTRRKGLALRGNAMIIANRSACPCMVVPMTEAALVASVKAADLELAAAEEEELASGSETDSEDEEPLGTPTGAAAASASGGGTPPHGKDREGGHHSGAEDEGQHAAGSPEPGGGGGGLNVLRGGSAAAIKQIRAPIEAFFKRRGSGGAATAGGSSTSGGGAGEPADRRAALLVALQGGGPGGLAPGRYLVEVDGHGAVRSVKPHQHHQGALLGSPRSSAAAAGGEVPLSCSTAGGAAAAGAAGLAGAAAGAAAASGGEGTGAGASGGAPGAAAPLLAESAADSSSARISDPSSLICAASLEDGVAGGEELLPPALAAAAHTAVPPQQQQQQQRAREQLERLLVDEH